MSVVKDRISSSIDIGSISSNSCATTSQHSLDNVVLSSQNSQYSTECDLYMRIR